MARRNPPIVATPGQPIAGILTQEHCQGLEGCLRSAGTVQAILDALRDAGIPNEAVEQEVAANRQLASKLLQHFGQGNG